MNTSDYGSVFANGRKTHQAKYAPFVKIYFHIQIYHQFLTSGNVLAVNVIFGVVYVSKPLCVSVRFAKWDTVMKLRKCAQPAMSNTVTTV